MRLLSVSMSLTFSFSFLACGSSETENSPRTSTQTVATATGNQNQNQNQNNGGATTPVDYPINQNLTMVTDCSTTSWGCTGPGTYVFPALSAAKTVSVKVKVTFDEAAWIALGFNPPNYLNTQFNGLNYSCRMQTCPASATAAQCQMYAYTQNHGTMPAWDEGGNLTVHLDHQGSIAYLEPEMDVPAGKIYRVYCNLHGLLLSTYTPVGSRPLVVRERRQ